MVIAIVYFINNYNKYAKCQFGSLTVNSKSPQFGSQYYERGF